MCRSRRELSNVQRLFTFKNRRRYSRERAPRSLGGNFNLIFIRLVGQRCWRFNITPSLQCPTEVIHTLINLISILDASDAKIRVLPSALSTHRFLDDLQQDWRMMPRKAVMPHLELANDVNAWDAMMQESGSRLRPFLPGPNRAGGSS